MLIDEIKAIKSTRKELTEFGWTVGMAAVILAGFLFWHRKSTYPHFLAVGLALIFMGQFAPAILTPLQRIWMTVAVIMGWFMTRVILGILFFGILTPVRLAAALFGKQFLDFRFEKSRKSYWHYREATEIDKAGYENQF